MQNKRQTGALQFVKTRLYGWTWEVCLLFRLIAQHSD